MSNFGNIFPAPTIWCKNIITDNIWSTLYSTPRLKQPHHPVKSPYCHWRLKIMNRTFNEGVSALENIYTTLDKLPPGDSTDFFILYTADGFEGTRYAGPYIGTEFALAQFNDIVSYEGIKNARIETRLTLEVQEKEKLSKICICKNCNLTNEYAEPNQTDGSYICYNCRNAW